MKIKPCSLTLRIFSAFMALVMGMTTLPVSVWAAAIPAPSLESNEEPADIAPPARTPKRLPAVRIPIKDTVEFTKAPGAAEFAQVRLEQPLYPIGKPTDAENRELAAALTKYFKRNDKNDQSLLAAFLESNPQSAWKPALLVNLGLTWRRAGYFSRSLKAWEEAWKLSRSAVDYQSRIIADRAFAELVQFNAWVGRAETVEPLLAEVKDRQLTGDAAEIVSGVRQGLWVMKNNPQQGFMCGPFALSQIASVSADSSLKARTLLGAKSPHHGFNLVQLRSLAADIGLEYQIARRQPGSAIPPKSVIHWKLNHYGAVQKSDGRRHLIQDSTMTYKYGQALWISTDALEEEASGLFLIPAGPLPAGWQPVPDSEAETVFGRGPGADQDQTATTPCDSMSCPGGGERHMARASVHLMLLSLNIADIPFDSSSPVGPDVAFRVTYNQREMDASVIQNYSNLGYNWTHPYFSYLEDIGPDEEDRLTVRRKVGGGGWITHAGYTLASGEPSLTGIYTIDRFGGVLRYFRTAANPSTEWYELLLPDGSKQVFEHKETLTQGNKRRFHLTQEVDPSGNAVVLSYDGVRITHINDALGRTTELLYGNNAHPNRITGVTALGRTASFNYDNNGRLTKITDTMGLTSAFTYAGVSSLITSMTTPYGTTTFVVTETALLTDAFVKTLRITDPNGDAELFVSKNYAGIPGAETYCPSSYPFENANLDHRNTLHFGKKLLKQISMPADNQATIYHWLHADVVGVSTFSPILESVKPPNQSRVWFRYPGQVSATSAQGITFARPSVVARMVEDPSGGAIPVEEIQLYEYNAQGRITKYTDPRGRITRVDYKTNNPRDVDKVKQEVAANTFEVLAEFGNYNAQHRPASYTDAARQTYTLAWNTDGSIASITKPAVGSPPFAEVIRFIYYQPPDAREGQLQYIHRDWSNNGSPATKSTLFDYDGYGRVWKVKDVSDNYTLTYDYDLFDRPTKVTYPDATFEQYAYDKLDLVRSRDRNGHWTHMTYDKVGRPLTVKDRLGRVTSFSWCGCGGLDQMTDPRGHITTWQRDNHGRVTDKIYHDTKTTHYEYQPYSGRLASVTDAKNQVKRYAYYKDGTLKNVSYDNEAIATLDLSFTYDSVYRRLTQVADDMGTITFTYKPITTGGTLGAGKVATEVAADSAITYGFDELGRQIARSIDGTGESMTFDTLGRLASHVTGIGTFTPAYVGDTHRLDTYSYPNGQVADLDYFTGTGDFRLKQIWNKKSGSATVSKFDYAYDVLGRIKTWTKQADAATPEVMSLDYDLEDQLLGALITPQEGSPTKGFNYTYDDMGNRTREQLDVNTGGLPARKSTVTKSTYNSVNQFDPVGGQSGANPLPVRFMGKVNEPARVTVGGVSAKTLADSDQAPNGRVFTATKELNAGTHSVTIQAEDYAMGEEGPHGGNVTSEIYDLKVAAGTTRSFVYDNNGNCTRKGGVTYEWDAEDRLVAINNGLLRTEFTYDCFGRRVKIVELNNNVPTSTKKFVWYGTEIAEERNEAGEVTKRFYAEGFVRYDPQVARYYTRDHLGSVREVTDGSGNVVARYNYDPYGRVTKVGSEDADFLYTGHYYHALSGLHLALYRAYDGDTGRWLSRDPIAEHGGINLYGYVGNNPIMFYDPLGLDFWTDLGNGLNNTVSGIGEAMGQGLYDLTHLQWSQDQYLRIADKMYSLDTPENPAATPYIVTALGVSCAATAVASAALTSESLAMSGCYRVGANVTRRAASPFLRNTGSRWFSKMQTDALLQTPRLGNFAGSSTWYGNLWNWATTFRYAQTGGGEVVYNWLTRTIIHANPFF